MRTPELTLREFAKLVADCRAAQKLYFRTLNPRDLEHSKSLEKRVDIAVRDCLEQPRLFDRKEVADAP